MGTRINTACLMKSPKLFPYGAYRTGITGVGVSAGLGVGVSVGVAVGVIREGGMGVGARTAPPGTTWQLYGAGSQT